VLFRSDLGGEAAVELEAVGGIRDVELGLGEGFAAALDLEPSEGIGLAVHGISELEEELGAIEGGGLAPRATIEGFPSGLDGGAGVFSRGLGHDRDKLAIGRISKLARLAGRTIDPFSTDEHLIAFHWRGPSLGRGAVYRKEGAGSVEKTRRGGTRTYGRTQGALQGVEGME